MNRLGMTLCCMFARPRFIKNIDCFIRERPIRDVSVSKRHTRIKCFRSICNTMKISIIG